MSHEEFFDEYGRVVLQQTGEYDWFTVEDLFQAFKSRLMAEVVAGYPMRVFENAASVLLAMDAHIQPLIDKPEEL